MCGGPVCGAVLLLERLMDDVLGVLFVSEIVDGAARVCDV
jgi:hypothetical protein